MAVLGDLVEEGPLGGLDVLHELALEVGDLGGVDLVQESWEKEAGVFNFSAGDVSLSMNQNYK